MKDKMEQISATIEPTINAMGYDLVGVEFASERAHAILRIYIDKGEGVGLDDCQWVSKQVSGLLDLEEPFKGSYRLEVSSPGVDRPLFKPEDFVRFAGNIAKIQMKQLLSGRKNFRGRLQGMKHNNVLVEVDGEQWQLPINLIRKAHLAPES